MDTNDDAEPTSSSDNDPTTTTSGGTLQRDNPTLFATVQALRTQVVLAAANANAQPETTTKNPGPLQTALTKRRGTLTVLAEYKRKLAAASSSLSANTAATTNAGSSSASITTNSWDVEFLSPVFREFGAAAMAVLADPRLGQCSADDVARAVAEQTRGAATRPQPALPVVNSDILLLTRASVAPGSSSQQEQQQCYYAHWQMAHSAALGAAAIVLHCDYLLMDSSSSSSSSSSTNEEKEEDPQSLVLWQDNVSLLASLMRAAAAVQLECVVAVSSLAQAELALAAGAQILSVTNGAGASVAEKKACIPDEHWLTTNSNICKIAHISTPTPSSSSTDKSNSSSNKSLSDEIEQAWAIRDAGFQCAWVSDALYKLLDVSTEHPGAIIQAMRNKASLKFASPQAKSGRGEGAREYLGDILM